MSPSWQDSILISSGITQKITGWSFTTNTQPVAVAVWPQFNSAAAMGALVNTQKGTKALNMIVYPTTDCHIAIDAVPNTLGPNAAILKANTEYVFNLHPMTQTIYFLDAISGPGPVYIRFVMP